MIQKNIWTIPIDQRIIEMKDIKIDQVPTNHYPIKSIIVK